MTINCSDGSQISVYLRLGLVGRRVGVAIKGGWRGWGGESVLAGQFSNLIREAGVSLDQSTDVIKCVELHTRCYFPDFYIIT